MVEPSTRDRSRVVITGAQGMIGRAARFGIKLSRHDLDVTERHAVATLARTHAPSAVLHLAAVGIENAETHPDLAFQTNVFGSYLVALAAAASKVPLIVLSSGAVFGGRGREMHDESASPDPVNVYGRTKWLAELIVRQTWKESLIVRTGWVFGGHQAHHRKFVDLVVERALCDEAIDAASDDWGTPTSVFDLLDEIVCALD